MTEGVEIERKFLVAELPADIGAWEAARIEQGYLAITGEVEVRIRRREGSGPTLTIKSAPGLRRTEEELALMPDRFERLWPLTKGRRVVKTRHVREVSPGVVFEVDVYHERLDGLMTLEIEFADADAAEAFTPPGWVERDVTGQAEFANQTLAVRGRPSM